MFVFLYNDCRRKQFIPMDSANQTPPLLLRIRNELRLRLVDSHSYLKPNELCLPLDNAEIMADLRALAAFDFIDAQYYLLSQQSATHRSNMNQFMSQSLKVKVLSPISVCKALLQEGAQALSREQRRRHVSYMAHHRRELEKDQPIRALVRNFFFLCAICWSCKMTRRCTFTPRTCGWHLQIRPRSSCCPLLRDGGMHFLNPETASHLVQRVLARDPRTSPQECRISFARWLDWKIARVFPRAWVYCNGTKKAARRNYGWRSTLHILATLSPMRWRNCAVSMSWLLGTTATRIQSVRSLLLP